MRETKGGRISGTSSYWQWKSPLPYLFGGLALMMGLVIVALIILICSHPRRQQSPEEKQITAKASTTDQLPSISTVVVIMAGDHNPTYLAAPVSCTFSSTLPTKDDHFS